MPIRKVRAISTVWSVIITAQIPTKLWPIDVSIRSWTVFLPRALKSLHPPNIVPPLAAVIMESRRTTIAENVNMQSLDCHKWRHTSTGTWMSSAQCIDVCSREIFPWSYGRCIAPRNPVARVASHPIEIISRQLWNRHGPVMWETLLEQTQLDEVKIQFKVHFLTYYINPGVQQQAAQWFNAMLHAQVKREATTQNYLCFQNPFMSRRPKKGDNVGWRLI